MIASASTPSIRDELADVKWTGNVKPVDARTQRRVLDAFDRQGAVQSTKLKPPKADARDMTETAVLILDMFRQGLTTSEVAEACGVHRIQIACFRNWVAIFHGVSVAKFRVNNERKYKVGGVVLSAVGESEMRSAPRRHRTAPEICPRSTWVRFSDCPTA